MASEKCAKKRAHDERHSFPFGLLLLGLSLIAASSVPAEAPPAFLTKWGTYCSTAVSGVDGYDGQFDLPEDMVVDASGNIYVVDQSNHRIQVFGGPWLDFFIGKPELPSSR